MTPLPIGKAGPPRALARPVRRLLATMLLAALSALAPRAHAQPAGPMDPMGPMGAMGGMAGPGMALGGPHLDHMLDSVNATADQRAQIKQILQSARTDLQAQRAAGQGLQAQSQALFAQPTVDAQAAEALRQQQLAQHDAATRRMLQAQLAVSNVLTPVQRQTLATRMAQRQALMQRQQAERAALDSSSR